MDFEAFCRRLETLRLDRAIGPAKPYKPLLVAAVVVQIAKGKLTSSIVPLDGGLTSVFEQLLLALYPDWPKKRADVRYPFRHLENGGIWKLVPLPSEASAFMSTSAAGGRARDLLKRVAYAKLDDQVFTALSESTQAQLRVLTLLTERYFPADANRIFMRIMAGVTVDEPRPPHSASDLTERLIEEIFYSEWKTTPFFAKFGVELSSVERFGLAGRQTLTPVNAIDLLGFSPSRAEWWVFELKRGRTPDAVVGQVSRYLGWMTEDRRPAKQGVVGVILAGESHPKLVYAVRANPRISLWTYDQQLRLARVE